VGCAAGHFRISGSPSEKGGFFSLASWRDALARLAAFFFTTVTLSILPFACKERCDEEPWFRDEITPRMTLPRNVAKPLTPWDEADNHQTQVNSLIPRNPAHHFFHGKPGFTVKSDPGLLA